MIPEKIYLQYYGSDTLDPEDYDADIDTSDVSWCQDRIFDSDIEYTLTPTAKKFADEKPKEDGEYLWSKCGKEWQISYYSDGSWGNDYGDWDDPVYWCEIVLPNLPMECNE